MDPEPRAWIAALRTGHDRLAAFVSGADDDDLTHRSMGTDWSVAQVLSHLGSSAEIGLASIEGAPIENEAVWDRWNAKGPADMARSAIAADERVVDWYEALSDDELTSRQVRMSFLPAPIPALTASGFRLSELALHSWDVFASFDPTATLAPDATELLLEVLPMMMGFTGRFRPRETRPPGETTIGVTTTDPERQYELQIGDSIELRPATGGPTSGSLTLPAEALLRLAAGRLPRDREAGATIDGALTLDQLRTAFPGY